MNLQTLLALWPKIQEALAAVGVQMSLGQVLSLVSRLAPVVKGGGSSTPASGPTIPDHLTLGADADLAPDGVALIGFSPQNHQGADLRDWHNAKYIAYAYLVANQIQPSKTWASEAVPVLSRLVPSVPWQAADTETLVYGDEYIYTAPRDASLLHREDLNRQQFIWGAFNA